MVNFKQETEYHNSCVRNKHRKRLKNDDIFRIIDHIKVKGHRVVNQAWHFWNKGLFEIVLTVHLYTGLPTKNEIVKIAWIYFNIRIAILNTVFYGLNLLIMQIYKFTVAIMNIKKETV